MSRSEYRFVLTSFIITFFIILIYKIIFLIPKNTNINIALKLYYTRHNTKKLKLDEISCSVFKYIFIL